MKLGNAHDNEKFEFVCNLWSRNMEIRKRCELVSAKKQQFFHSCSILFLNNRQIIILFFCLLVCYLLPSAGPIIVLNLCARVPESLIHSFPEIVSQNLAK